MRYLWCVPAVLLAGCVGPPTRPAGPTLDERVTGLEERVQRLDNRADSGQVVELMQRVETLHAELRELRGEVESLGNDSESLNRRQRELYLDLDRRLQGVEAGGRPATDPAPAAGPVGVLAPSPEDGGVAVQRADYEAAFQLLQQGRYPAAIAAFQAYLQRYPAGRYADNAQYWLGEAYYVTREYPTALGEFNKLVAQYPESQKVPDALLKIGYVHYELQQWDSAREVLTGVAQRVPGTTIARLADQRLQRMRQEGR